MKRATRSTALLLLAGCGAAPASPGDANVPEEVSCHECSIEVEDLLTIGDTTTAGSFDGRPTSVHQDGRGRYWINVLDAFPMVYDPSTRVLRRYGRAGQGPGEFTRPHVAAVLPGDSMLVHDFGRLHVIGPNDSIARSIIDPTRSWPQAVIRWPDLATAQPNPYTGGQPRLHTVMATYDLSTDSAMVRDTFLAVLRDPSADPAVDYARGLRVPGAPSAGGDFWISRLNAYQLVRYTAAGATADTIVRSIPWFPPGGPIGIGAPDRKASPRMQENWVDEKGRLWVMVAEPLEPGNAWDNVAAGGNEVRLASMPADYKLKRTLIEVIDPAAKRVITRHTFDGYIVGLLPGNRVASFVETEDGIPILTIHRLTLRGPDQ